MGGLFENGFMLVRFMIYLYITAQHVCRAVLATSEMSVCPSVRPSVKRVNYNKMKETVPTFLFQMKERLS